MIRQITRHRTAYILTLIALLWFVGTCIASAQDKPALTNTPAAFPEIWFNKLVGITPREPSSDQLLSFVDALRRHHLPSITENEADTAPRFVAVSLSNKGAETDTFFSTGRSFSSAMHGVLSKIAQDKKEQLTWPWVRIDVARDVREVNLNEALRRGELRTSRFGLALSRADGRVFLAHQEIPANLVNVGAYLFESDSFFFDEQRSFRLFREHRLIQELSPELLLESAKLAGNYLVKAVNDVGAFSYLYDFKNDKDKSEYNVLRHAGTTYSMLELYEVTKDPALHQRKIPRILGYLLILT